MEILSVQTIFRPRNLIVAGIVLAACLLAGGYYAYDLKCKNQEAPAIALFSGKRFSSEELIRAEIAFADAKLNKYTLKDGSILVPSADRDRYILALKNSNILATPDKSKTSNCSTSFWESEKQREEKSLREKQEKLAAVIRTFHGIETADVLLDTMELKTGFQRERITSASITVRSVPNYVLSDSDLQAIANLVQGAVCGLKSENLTIVDTRTNQSWRHPILPSTETVTVSQKITFAAPEASDSQPFQTSHDTALEMLQPQNQPVLAQTEALLEPPRLGTLPACSPKTVNLVENSESAKVSNFSESISVNVWTGIGASISLVVFLLGMYTFRRFRARNMALQTVPQHSEDTKPVEEPQVMEIPLVENVPLDTSAPFPEPISEPAEEALPESVPIPSPEPQAERKAPMLPEILALENVPLEKLARILAEERPQTVALILAQLQHEKSRAILGILPEKLAVQVSGRISRCESPDLDILREVTSSILENVSELSENPEVSENSPEPEKPTENAVDTVFSQMRAVRFDDLQFMTLPELRAILEVSPPPVAVMAMIGAPPELVDKMLGILSRPEAEKVRKVLENPGKVRLSDVEKARRKMAEIASSI